MKKLALVAAICMLVATNASAGNKPCSGSKGGVDHCSSDGKFVCKDGSQSQSKKVCKK